MCGCVQYDSETLEGLEGKSRAPSLNPSKNCDEMAPLSPPSPPPLPGAGNPSPKLLTKTTGRVRASAPCGLRVVPSLMASASYGQAGVVYKLRFTGIDWKIVSTYEPKIMLTNSRVCCFGVVGRLADMCAGYSVVAWFACRG